MPGRFGCVVGTLRFGAKQEHPNADASPEGNIGIEHVGTLRVVIGIEPRPLKSFDVIVRLIARSRLVSAS